MAEVEHEDYIYHGLPNDGRSYVCSSFVTAMYKAAGLFKDIDDQIIPQEVHDRDLYNMKLYNTTFENPPL